MMTQTNNMVAYRHKQTKEFLSYYESADIEFHNGSDLIIWTTDFYECDKIFAAVCLNEENSKEWLIEEIIKSGRKIEDYELVPVKITYEIG